MKGDFSRFTFDRTKRYAGVRMQQGRVQLDADWNEQLDIASYLRQTVTADVIGPSGAPLSNGGFEVRLGTAPGATGDLILSAGRYYVDGILCENDAETSLNQQPDLPGLGAPPAAAPGAYAPGWYLVYLDVWQRSVTALEDPDLLELALGGPDTTTRMRTVWQAKLLHLTAANPACSDFPAGWRPPEPGQPATPETPLLAARSVRAPQENQLYRVEVHAGGGLTGANAATFKWSRDNAAVAALIRNPIETKQETFSQIVVTRQIGPDQAGGFAVGQWIEATDESRILEGLPGIFAQIADVQGQVLQVVGWPRPEDPVPDLPTRPIIRRWDSGNAVAITVPATNGGYLALEDGLEIRFGDDSSTWFHTGDHWVIPTRASAGVLWPQDATGQPVEQPPLGVEHHFAPLALVTLAGSTWALGTSCRNVFQPTTIIPGNVKLNRVGPDTFTGQLTVDGNLIVNDALSVGGAPGASLTMVNAPLVPSLGDDAARGIRFPAVNGATAYLRYLDQSNPVKLVLGADDPAAVALRQAGADRLTITGGKVGIGLSNPLEALHVQGNLRLDGSLSVRDGSQKAGRVLTAGNDGLATWQDLPTRRLGSPVFLPRAVAIANGGSGQTGWATFSLPTDKIPSDASAVLIEGQAAMDQPDAGAIDAIIAFRKGPDEEEYTLLRGRSAAGGDSVAWGGQGLFPFQNNSIQYIVSGPGFNWGWWIRLIGYFP